MTLPSSGPLSLSDIQGEFGGSNPIGMNEYYAGGGLVPAGTTGTYGAVPSSGALSVQNFYGTSQFVPIYIEEVFSTWLYTGNSSTQTITNGINLSTYGGLVWTKSRSTATDHALVDTVRGADKVLHSESTAAQVTYADITSFNSTGYSLDSVSGWFNTSSRTYASWTFRKQPKFFDVVTYTGNNSTNVISHSLGSTPACIIVKQTSSSGNDWWVYHKDLPSPKNSRLKLNAIDASYNMGYQIWDTSSTTFTVFGSNGDSNQNGTSYVAYLFASNAGGFGLTGTDNVISCGSFTTDPSTGGATVNLGYEPQWLLVKSATSAQGWHLIDNMRGMANLGTYGDAAFVEPNTSSAESTGANCYPTANGFWYARSGSTTYIYIAIRRGPMKVPTSGTSVFAPVTATQSGNTTISTGFPVDFVIANNRSGANHLAVDRLRGGSQILQTASTAAEVGSAGGAFDYQSSILWKQYADGVSGVFWNFRRAPSFFDEVCYTGNGAGASQVNNHNLGVVPELIISKKRSASGGWVTWATGLSGSTYYLQLNATDGEYNGGATLFRSSTQYTWYWGDNVAGATYVTYLFASCPGVSKVGSYSGTGSTQTISCGFTGGARWVMVKRIDVDGYGWYVWDTARGMVSGTDPSLLLNSTAAEVNANSIYTTTGGFQIVSTAAGINASGGTYIYLAIA